jgi:hypothetical protein
MRGRVGAPTLSGSKRAPALKLGDAASGPQPDANGRHDDWKTMAWPVEMSGVNGNPEMPHAVRGSSTRDR